MKPNVGNIRFMRKAYKDPMNKEDGSWRLIYVGPSGQLIGSLNPQQTPKTLGFPGTLVGTPASSLASPLPESEQQGAAQPGATSQSGPAAQSTDKDAVNLDNVAPGDTPAIIGQNIIGVGSKVNESSIMVYEKAKNYRLFEFIWDPSKHTIGAQGTTGTQIGTHTGLTSADRLQ
jgi:hypothetical protein